MNHQIMIGASCTKNGIGGWAFTILSSQHTGIVKSYGFVYNTTFEEMELIAVIEAMKYVCKHYNKKDLVLIWTLSPHISSYLKNGECLEWVINDWKNVLNADLKKSFVKLLEQRPFKFEQLNHRTLANNLAEHAIQEAQMQTKET